MTCESLQARTETWSAPFTHVTTCHIRGASEARAEISQGAEPAAVLGSPSIHQRTPLLPLPLSASSFPGLQIPSGHCHGILRQPLGMMFPHLWLLFWSPSLSLQALSQCRRNGILWPLLAHAGTLHCLQNKIQQVVFPGLGKKTCLFFFALSCYGFSSTCKVEMMRKNQAWQLAIVSISCKSSGPSRYLGA